MLRLFDGLTVNPDLLVEVQIWGDPKFREPSAVEIKIGPDVTDMQTIKTFAIHWEDQPAVMKCLTDAGFTMGYMQPFGGRLLIRYFSDAAVIAKIKDLTLKIRELPWQIDAERTDTQGTLESPQI